MIMTTINKMSTKLGLVALGVLLAVGVGLSIDKADEKAIDVGATSQTVTSVFNSASWGVSSGPAWTSNTAGSSYVNGQGVQVNAAATPNATSVGSYTAVTSITVRYCTTSGTKGVGVVTMSSVSTSTVQYGPTITISKTGTPLLDSTLYDTTDGKINIAITCTQSSIFIYSIAITTEPLTVSSVFASKTWTVATGSLTWTSGVAGNGFTVGQGISFSSGTTANATSFDSFTGISAIRVQYCTAATTGAGTITMYSGSGEATMFGSAFTVTSTGGITLREASFTGTADGKVKISVASTANTVYVYSITITAVSQTQIAVFTSAAYGVAANAPAWTVGTAGSSFTSGRGIGHTASASSNATTTDTYSVITTIRVGYCTSSTTTGAGTIAIYTGPSNDTFYGASAATAVDVSGGLTVRYLTFNSMSSGKIKVVVSCTTATLYLYSVELTKTFVPYSYLMTSASDLSAGGTTTLAGLKWTTTLTGGTISGYDATYSRGVTFSSATTSAVVRSEIFVSPAGLTATIRKIVVKAATGVGGSGTLDVKVGGTSIGSAQALNATTTGPKTLTYLVSGGPLLGHIGLYFTNTGGQALYLDSITVFVDILPDYANAAAWASRLEAYNTCTEAGLAYDALDVDYDALSSAAKSYLASINLDDYVGATRTYNAVTAQAKYAKILIVSGHPSGAAVVNQPVTDNSLTILIMLGVISMSAIMIFALSKRKKDSYEA